jgi:hypothetical protein
MRDHDKYQSYMFLTKRKVCQYIRRTYSRWWITLILVVSSSGMTYANVVSIPTEEHNRNIWHTSWLIPQVVPVRLTLHRQCRIHYENVFTSWGSDHKTSLGPHALGARSWLIAQWTRNPYRTIGAVLKQTSSWGDLFGIHITRLEDTYLLTSTKAGATTLEVPTFHKPLPDLSNRRSPLST